MNICRKILFPWPITIPHRPRQQEVTSERKASRVSGVSFDLSDSGHFLQEVAVNERFKFH